MHVLIIILLLFDCKIQIRSEFGYEGRVLYFLDEQRNVIGVLKKKTAWYIILRSIREKVCHFCSSKDASSIAEKRNKIIKRVAEIQTWIGFSDSYKNSWAVKFTTLFIHKKIKFNLILFNRDWVLNLQVGLCLIKI